MDEADHLAKLDVAAAEAAINVADEIEGLAHDVENAKRLVAKAKRVQAGETAEEEEPPETPKSHEVDISALAPAEDEPPVPPPPPPPQGSMLKSALGAARSSVAIMNAAPAAELEGSDDEDDGQHATRVAAEHEKRSRAAIYIQRLWRGRTPHLCLKIRVAVGALPRRDRATAAEGGLDTMGAKLCEALGTQAWSRALHNTPDEWEEEDLASAMREVLTQPARSNHVALLALPTKHERAVLHVFAMKAASADPPLLSTPSTIAAAAIAPPVIPGGSARPSKTPPPPFASGGSTIAFTTAELHNEAGSPPQKTWLAAEEARISAREEEDDDGKNPEEALSRALEAAGVQRTKTSAAPWSGVLKAKRTSGGGSGEPRGGMQRTKSMTRVKADEETAKENAAKEARDALSKRAQAMAARYAAPAGGATDKAPVPTTVAGRFNVPSASAPKYGGGAPKYGGGAPKYGGGGGYSGYGGYGGGGYASKMPAAASKMPADAGSGQHKRWKVVGGRWVHE